MRIARPAVFCTLVLALFAWLPRAGACPFCSAPSLTLSEEVAQSDAVVLVQWVDGTKGGDNSAGQTVYEVVQVVKAPEGTVEKGKRITLARHRAGEKGDLFLLTGSGKSSIEWGSPREVTETSFNYITQAPSPEAPSKKRLAYFLKFLEFPDEMIANDAYGEFANSPYEEITPLKDVLPRERIRKWVADPETPGTRLGLYGLLLGLCGEEEDAQMMERKLSEPSEDFRLGIDGVMGGYLLLTGDQGLDLIDQTKLSNEADVPFSETYAAMQALRFMWTYGEGRIEKDRLRQSMRGLLDRPELADLVIADLARWQDWSVQDRLMELYDAEEYSIPSIKRAIVRYLLQSAKDAPSDEAETPAHVARAQQHLETLRDKDPKTVKEAERFFFLQ